jgi:hypothetical protein
MYVNSFPPTTEGGGSSPVFSAYLVKYFNDRGRGNTLILTVRKDDRQFI